MFDRLSNAIISRVGRIAAQPSVQVSLMTPAGPTFQRHQKRSTPHHANMGHAQQADAWLRQMHQAHEASRQQRYAEYREMADEEGIYYRALRRWQEMVFAPQSQAAKTPTGSRASYILHVDDGARPEVKRLLAADQTRLNTHTLVRGLLEEGRWVGDGIVELMADKTGFLGVRPHAAEHMRVMISAQGNYYELRESGHSWRRVHPFFVLHYAPDRPLNSHYGRSMWHSGRSTRRKAEAILDVIMLQVLQEGQGGESILWPFNYQTPADIAEFIENIEDNLDDQVWFDAQGTMVKRPVELLRMIPKIIPFKPSTTGKGPSFHQRRAPSIEACLKVFEALERHKFIDVGTPPILLGHEKDINGKNSAEVQGKVYAQQIIEGQQDCAELMADLHLRSLMLEGITPKDGEWHIEMKPPTAFDEQLRADVAFSRARATAQYVIAGVPLVLALQHGAGLSKMDAERIADDTSKEKALEGVLPRIAEQGDLEDLDSEARALMGEIFDTGQEGVKVNPAPRANLPENRLPEGMLSGEQ
ncbi:MAG: hypothetical protein ACE366_16700 [Bradymonadia bacterium]